MFRNIAVFPGVLHDEEAGFAVHENSIAAANAQVAQ